MNALLPLLLPLAVSMAAPPADLPAESSASPPSQGADLVEVHLGASTPGVRLVFAPPVDSGPDAEPYVIEVRAPTWGGPALSAAPAPGLTDEPLGAAPDLLASPVLASSVPTAAYATQPIEPLLEVPASEMVFLRHASADDIEPIAELEPTQETPLNGSVQAELASPPPEPDKEAEPPPEWVAAAENFEKACEGGYAEACTALAGMVASGQAGDVDMDLAHGFYQRGCDQGDADACAAIAPVSTTPAVADAEPMVLDTAPVSAPASVPVSAPASHAAVVAEAPAATVAPAFEVERSLVDSCSEGDNTACNELGERHAHGDGVPQDYQRASKLFQRSCAGGDMSACTNLGILYKVGEGVRQDETRAERLFQLACNGGVGDERACGLTTE